MKVQHSSARVKFYRHNSMEVIDASRDIHSVNVNKRISEPAGGFTIDLALRKDYFSLLKINDWVTIGFSNGLEVTPFDYMVGSIDEITRERSVGPKGATTTTLTLSGRDIGKQLLKTAIVVDPLVGSFLAQTLFNAKLIMEKFGGNGVGFFQSPDEVVCSILKEYFGKRLQCVPPASLQLQARFPAHLALYGIDVRSVYHTKGIILPVGNPNVGGSVWSTIEQFSNLVINELFTDTVQGCPALVLRERQWSHDAFAELGAVTVDANEVSQETFSISDQDTRNWFRVYPDAQFNCHEISDVAKLGYVANSSLKRSGLARLDPVAIAGSTGSSLEDELRVWVDLLTEWNYQNDKLLAGSLITRFRPDAHIGQRLDYTNARTRENYSFYIEGLTHSYVYPGASTTKFTLTRGTPRLTSAVGPRFPDLRAATNLVDWGEVSLLANPAALTSLTGATDVLTLPPGVA